jgi:hypothetical protein
MKTVDNSPALGRAGDLGRALAEGPRPSVPAGAGPRADAEHDQRFEADLLFLMSHLEHSLAGLEAARDDARFASGARLARTLLEQIFLFAQTHVEPADQAEAFAKAQAAYESAKGLENDLGWMSVRGFKSYFRPKKVDTRGADFAYQSMGQAVRSALAAYFLLFSDLLRDPAKSRQWMGTFQVFLDDLKKKW